MGKWMNDKDPDAEFLSSIRQSVIEWNYIARGGEHLDSSDRDQVAFQESLCKEEWFGKNETVDSWEKDDKVGFLDGLCDSFVVVSYLSFTLGIEYDYKFVTPHPYEYYMGVEVCIPDDMLIAALLKNFDGDWKGALLEVINSNWSKFDTYIESDETLYDDHCQAIMDQGRYTNVTWEKRGDCVVYLSGEGKILKGINYFEPELEQFV